MDILSLLQAIGIESTITSCGTGALKGQARCCGLNSDLMRLSIEWLLQSSPCRPEVEVHGCWQSVLVSCVLRVLAQLCVCALPHTLVYTSVRLCDVWWIVYLGGMWRKYVCKRNKQNFTSQDQG